MKVVSYQRLNVDFITPAVFRAILNLTGGEKATKKLMVQVTWVAIKLQVEFCYIHHAQQQPFEIFSVC